MLTQAWVGGIAVAMVAGSLAAWRAMRGRRKRAAKAKRTEDARKAGAERRAAQPQREPRPWRIYLNEAEIARREATLRAAKPPADEASTGSQR